MKIGGYAVSFFEKKWKKLWNIRKKIKKIKKYEKNIILFFEMKNGVVKRKWKKKIRKIKMNLDRMWWGDWKWCRQEKMKKKIRKIKMNLDRMWWGEWKWCRQEKIKKNKKNKKENRYNVMGTMKMVS